MAERMCSFFLIAVQRYKNNLYIRFIKAKFIGMITCKHYRLGFDILALVLFLAVILYALDC